MVATSVRNRELKQQRLEVEDLDREICSFFNVQYRPIRTSGEAFVMIESLHSLGISIDIVYSTCLFSCDKSVTVSIFKIGQNKIATANSLDLVSAFKMACQKFFEKYDGRLM